MKDNESDYDVITVGSRVAGSITGILLGEKGYRVLVLDRAKFPSDTLSTHFFRAPALRAFNKVEVYNEVQVATFTETWITSKCEQTEIYRDHPLEYVEKVINYLLANLK